MDGLQKIIRQKSPLLVFIYFLYFLLVYLLKWKFSFKITSLSYLVGAGVGIYFLDFAEEFFRLKPSPFRSVIFSGLFVVVSFFIVTSSGSMLGSGLVLTIYLTLILWQITEWEIAGNLNSWYQMVAGPVRPQLQGWLLLIFVAVFFIETYLFVTALS